jgi:hypothetical protein
MTTTFSIKQKIAEARARLGSARADRILEDAESKLPFGKCLTLAQRLLVLENAMRTQQRPETAIRAQQRPTAMVRDDRAPDEKSYDEWMAEYDSISDPFLKTEFYRAHIRDMKSARVRAMYPNAYVLARRKARRR